MRAHRFTALLFALATLAVTAWATEVKILEWNIKRAVGANNPNSAAQPYLARIVNYLDPDIWLIQELGGNSSGWNWINQRAALDTFIQTYLTIYGPSPQRDVDYYVYVNTRSDGYTSCAVVSKYPFHTATDVYIGPPGRGFTSARVNVPGTNGLLVFTGHFDSGDTSTDAQNRQTNAEGARDTVNSMASTYPGSAIVLTGDFNENEDADLPKVYPLGTILPNGHAYWPITTVLQTPTYDLVPLQPFGDKRTWRSTSPSQRFDYILVSTNNGVRDDVTVLNKGVFNSAQNTPPGVYAGDSANASDHLAVWAVLDVNAGAGLATVTGRVTLESYAGPAGLSALMQFRSPGTQTVLHSDLATLNASGGYTLTGVPAGTYDIAVKFPNWLRQVLPNRVVVGPTTTGVDFTLRNGDADGNNSVDLADLNSVLTYFGNAGGAGDLTWNGSVDLVDLNIVLTNFGLQGDL